MEKLALIQLCIRNDERAIEELQAHLVVLRQQEQIALFELEAEKQLEEDLPL